MKYNLPDRAYSDILQLAEKYKLEDVILFGSRAVGRHWERSDIDLAVRGGDTTGFALAADEEIRTLLLIDVVNLDKSVQPELLESIRREGVVLVGELPENSGEPEARICTGRGESAGCTDSDRFGQSLRDLL